MKEKRFTNKKRNNYTKRYIYRKTKKKMMGGASSESDNKPSIHVTKKPKITPQGASAPDEPRLSTKKKRQREEPSPPPAPPPPASYDDANGDDATDDGAMDHTTVDVVAGEVTGQVTGQLTGQVTGDVVTSDDTNEDDDDEEVESLKDRNFKNRQHLTHGENQGDIYIDERHDEVIDAPKPGHFENTLMLMTSINDNDKAINFKDYFSDRCQIVALNQIMTPQNFNKICIKDCFSGQFIPGFNNFIDMATTSMKSFLDTNKNFNFQKTTGLTFNDGVPHPYTYRVNNDKLMFEYFKLNNGGADSDSEWSQENEMKRHLYILNQYWQKFLDFVEEFIDTKKRPYISDIIAALKQINFDGFKTLKGHYTAPTFTISREPIQDEPASIPFTLSQSSCADYVNKSGGSAAPRKENGGSDEETACCKRINALFDRCFNGDNENTMKAKKREGFALLKFLGDTSHIFEAYLMDKIIHTPIPTNATMGGSSSSSSSSSSSPSSLNIPEKCRNIVAEKLKTTGVTDDNMPPELRVIDPPEIWLFLDEIPLMIRSMSAKWLTGVNVRRRFSEIGDDVPSLPTGHALQYKYDPFLKLKSQYSYIKRYHAYATNTKGLSVPKSLLDGDGSYKDINDIIVIIQSSLSLIHI